MERLFAKRMRNVHDSSLRDVLQTTPGVISFAGGLPDEHAFDLETIAAISAKVSRDLGAWQYIPTEGSPPLRQAIADHLSPLGIEAEAENILVTSGSQQALDLVAKAFIDPGDGVLMETPGYLGARKAFENHEAILHPLPLEEDGIRLDALREVSSAKPRPKLLYTVSTFQNPSGCTLSEGKRRHLLDVARDQGFLIVEDSAYHHLRYEAAEIPPIKSMETAPTVIYLGSFSKTLLPGVRIGWVVAPREIIAKLSLLKQATDLATNSFGQLFVLTWLREVGLRPPIALYREKRDRSLASLERTMPQGCAWNPTEGGFFLWVRLPSTLDAASLLPLARENGVAFVPGHAFGGERNALRFSFSQVALADIETGVERLAQSIKSLELTTKI